MRTDEGGKMQEKETLDERLPGLFEPDTLLPVQYFESMRKKHLLEGEKRLVLSVLEDAVDCFQKCIDSTTNKGQRLFREADEWIFLEDKHWVFSFDNVCDMLDINPEYMRRGLKLWKERKLAQIEQLVAVNAEKPVEHVPLEAPAKQPPENLPSPQLAAEPATKPIVAKVLAPAPRPKSVARVRRPGRGLHKARA